ncbi:hypothetical protein [Photorhabdus bodei]|nr:hypothetical protein [Photorhabdus bodei]
MTGVSKCSQQSGNLKDNGYILGFYYAVIYLRFVTSWYGQKVGLN